MDAPVWSAERLRTASDAAGVALWSWDVDTNEINMDQRGYALWGLPRDGSLTFEKLDRQIYPADRGMVRRTIVATRTKPGPYEIDFRILRDGKIHWIASRGLGADEGIVGRVMFGIFLDITDLKQAEEASETLADEMSHRVKNLFAIAASLISISARSAATTTEMARDLRQRLATLAIAHDLIRMHPEHEGRGTVRLGELFVALLAPYDDRGSVGDRIRVTLPDMLVGENAATTLTLIVHELATNAVKYGSLLVARGSLEVSGDSHNGDMAIRWTERGGPLVSAPAGPEGFGGKLISRSVTGQLGGTIDHDWQPKGVVVTLRLSKERLAA